MQNRSGPVAIAGDGTISMGMFAGLWHDDGHGCNWSHDSAYDGEWVADVAPDPRDPNVVFAVTSTGSPPGEHRYNGVIRRDASGTSSDQGTKAELLATRLLVTPRGDGLRFYMSAVEGQIAPDDGGIARPNYVTRVSDDGGQSWREHVLGPADGTFRMQAVDPRTPIASSPASTAPAATTRNRPRQRARQQRRRRDLERAAAGERHRRRGVRARRAAVHRQHRRHDRRSRTQGPVAGARPGPAAVKLANADYPVQCLAYQQATDTLYACQHFWFGKVSQQDGGFSALVKLNEVGGFVACDGIDVAAQCEQQLCTAYCGFGHFAQAPLCTAYDTPSCGPGAAAVEPATASSGPATDGGAPSAAPQPAVAPAVAAPNALQSPPKPTPARRATRSALAPGGSRRAGPAAPASGCALALALAAFARRRRARRR